MDEYRDETVISKEEKAFQESRDQWNHYINLEMSNLNSETDSTSKNSSQGSFEGDRFHKLSEISQWLDLEENSDFSDPNRNCVINTKNSGVMLIVFSIEGIKEGLYFRDENWKGGKWSKANNTYDFFALCHIFSKLVDSLNHEDINDDLIEN